MNTRCYDHRGNTQDCERGYRFLGTIRLPREPLITLPESAPAPVCPVCFLLSELQNPRCKGR